MSISAYICLIIMSILRVKCKHSIVTDQQKLGHLRYVFRLVKVTLKKSDNAL